MESTCNIISRFQPDLYLIDYLFVYGLNIVTNENILNVLKSNTGKTLLCIKRFDYGKQKFTRISAKEFINLNSYNTELIEYCKSHYYFRNVKF